MTPPGAGGPLGELPLRLWEAYAFLHRVRVSAGAAAVGPSPASGLYDGEYFRRQLVEEILPFWEEHSVDRRHGGFLVHLDRRGRIYDASRKFAAMQGRMVYAFSIGHRLQPGAGYLDRAEQGVQFLFDHFWDDRFGGWYRVVHRDGRPDVTVKHMFDHSYVLIGLSEYYRETRDPEVLGYIERTCQRLADHLWDREHLGYFECCRRDWRVRASRKTICTHLDVLAVAISLAETLGGRRNAEWIEQIADIIVQRMRDRRHGSLLEIFDRDWRYDPLATRDKIEFGHNLKGAWMLLRAYELTGNRDHYAIARRLVDYCLRYGWDDENGGFYQHGYRNGMLARDEKLWWPECEGILVLLRLHRLSGDPRYFEYFTRLTSFVDRHFRDAEAGEWFRTVSRDGTARDTRKGGDYKAAFHTAETCLHARRDLEPRPPAATT